MTLDQPSILEILNQLFEIEKKLQDNPLARSIGRNIKRMRAPLTEAGYTAHNPLGEKYDLTRLDCEAMVSGETADDLVIVEVIKPIIYFQEESGNILLQKAVVITEGSRENS